MTKPESERRDSRALEPELISDPIAKAEAEARNGLRQYDAAFKTIQTALERDEFKLRLSLVLALHREALAGISSYAGNFRPAGVDIEGSKHNPPGAHLVPELIEEMCDYVNEHWNDATPIHLRGLRNVAPKLDTSLCRRQRQDITNSIVCCSLDTSWRLASGYPDNSRSDRR